MTLGEALSQNVQSEDAEDGRYPYICYGVVTNIDDPLKCGQVKARIGAQDSGSESEWLVNPLGGSIEVIPNKSDTILCGFFNGDVHHGWFLPFPITTSNNRPTEAMLLATTFIGMYNDLVGKFNNLKADYNKVQADVIAINTLVCTTGLAVAAAVAKAATPYTATSAQDSDADAAKGQASDGSVPSAIQQSKVVLSGKAKIR